MCSMYLFFKLCYLPLQLLIALAKILYLSLKCFHINSLWWATMKVLLQKSKVHKELHDQHWGKDLVNAGTHSRASDGFSGCS